MSREMNSNTVLNLAQHFSSGWQSPRLLPERAVLRFTLLWTAILLCLKSGKAQWAGRKYLIFLDISTCQGGHFFFHPNPVSYILWCSTEIWQLIYRFFYLGWRPVKNDTLICYPSKSVRGQIQSKQISRVCLLSVQKWSRAWGHARQYISFQNCTVVIYAYRHVKCKHNVSMLCSCYINKYEKSRYESIFFFFFFCYK